MYLSNNYPGDCEKKILIPSNQTDQRWMGLQKVQHKGRPNKAMG